MKTTQEPVPTSPAVTDEPVLDADELKTLAKLLDALMEVDFDMKRNQGLEANAC